MPAADTIPRLAVLLLAHAARRWPADLREQSHRAWLAELHALAADPDTGRWARTWQALRFSLSLAVRRPAPSSTPLPPVVTAPRPARELFVAAIGVAIFGTPIAMLLVHLPAAVADRLPDPDSTDAVHRLPLLALVPALTAVGLLAGRRLARRDTSGGVTRTVAIIIVGWCCARLLPMFGGILTALPGLALWALGLWAAAQAIIRLPRGPRRPLVWLALAAGMLIMADLAVISTVWLGVDAGDAPRAYALSWFPGALLDPAVAVPMGAGTAGDPATNTVLDAVEFLPHGLIITSAFALAYVHASRRASDRYAGHA
ncbi:hypothetical protein O7598_10200 [Micromonospora sp. WMMC241]|uniref:hypothetical protein n=1 Tax=Micromonospora sp. WMMC241 TaxID=3015159 RepID=UPI0022B60815|nr:hypothetical protein [Micromonospora sp. WMMC241]MCZ7436762.1 hypothetical protein [Micromonospora sp. WMMC241]